VIHVAIVVGNTILGIRRNADFATPTRAPSIFPLRAWRMGLRAQTYPVTREKMDTPMRPCKNTRTKGNCKSRGKPSSEDAGRKRSVSKARTRCVMTTSKDANPRSPYGEKVSFASAVGGGAQLSTADRREITHIYPFYIFTLQAHIVCTPSCHLPSIRARKDVTRTRP
jgi:hypothetical protein